MMMTMTTMMAMMTMTMTAMGDVVLTEGSVNDADCVYGEECIPSLKHDLDAFVPIAKCICPNFKMYSCSQRGMHSLPETRS